MFSASRQIRARSAACAEPQDPGTGQPLGDSASARDSASTNSSERAPGRVRAHVSEECLRRPAPPPQHPPRCRRSALLDCAPAGLGLSASNAPMSQEAPTTPRPRTEPTPMSSSGDSSAPDRQDVPSAAQRVRNGPASTAGTRRSGGDAAGDGSYFLEPSVARPRGDPARTAGAASSSSASMLLDPRRSLVAAAVGPGQRRRSVTLLRRRAPPHYRRCVVGVDLTARRAGGRPRSSSSRCRAVYTVAFAYGLAHGWCCHPPRRVHRAVLERPRRSQGPRAL